MSTFLGRNKPSSSLLLTASLLLAAGIVRANVVNFDFNPGVDHSNVTIFDISGFRFTATTGAFSVRDYNPPAGQFYLFIGSGDSAQPPGAPLSTVTFQRIGGGVFDLISLSEIADAAGSFTPNALLLTTNLGGSKDMYFNVPNIPFPTDFSFSLPGFAGITTMTFVENERVSAAFDHFSLRIADVPEPGSFGLVGLILAGLATLRRYRRQVRGLPSVGAGVTTSYPTATASAVFGLSVSDPQPRSRLANS